MTTVLLVFFGLSSCASLTLIAALALGARRTAPVDSGVLETNVLTSKTESKPGFVPSYSH